MHRRKVVLGGAAVAALSAKHAAAQATWAPSRPVTLVVPLAPGSTGDILSRTMAEVWGQRLGQPILVDNRPAAGGVVATESLKNAAPDGHTLGLVSQGTIVFNHFLTRDPRYDARQDLTLIAPLATVTNAMVVAKASPFRSPADLVAAAKARPGALTYFLGRRRHLAPHLDGLVRAARRNRARARALPRRACRDHRGDERRGRGRLLQHPDRARADPGRRAPSHRRHLGGAERVPAGGAQPAGTRRRRLRTDHLDGPRRARTHAGAGRGAHGGETTRGLDDPATWAKLRQQGFEAMPRLDPPAFASFVNSEFTKWGPVIRATGATAD
jgi:hypothetical protein